MRARSLPSRVNARRDKLTLVAKRVGRPRVLQLGRGRPCLMIPLRRKPTCRRGRKLSASSLEGRVLWKRAGGFILREPGVRSVTPIEKAPELFRTHGLRSRDTKGVALL